MKPRLQEIIVVMPTHLECYRELLRGVGAFANARATWSVQYFTPRDNFVDLIQQHRPAGVLLGDVVSTELAQVVQASAPIAVGVAVDHLDVSFPAGVGVDDERVGELAAEHFLAKKYVHFAFVGSASDRWSIQRLAGFRRVLAVAGFSPTVSTPDWEPISTGRGWRKAYPDAELAPLLASLPKPVALFACNDIRGREIVEACRSANLRVPEDVAILGVDNDTLNCALSHPPLSSVSIPWHRIGFVAAEQLDALLEGRSVAHRTEIPPVGVIERQSSDCVAIADPDVAAALRYMREHAHVGFSIDAVAESASVGRRTLEKKFRNLLGRSLLDEARRVHVERAKELLAQTDLPVAEVSRRSGFQDVSWFSVCFSKTVGVSPSGFRVRVAK